MPALPNVTEQADYAPSSSTEHAEQVPPPGPELPSSDQRYPVRENYQPPTRYTDESQ